MSKANRVKMRIAGVILFIALVFPAWAADPNVATPVFTPDGGIFYTEPNVIITCATPGAEIRYTIDGSDPNSGTVIASGESVFIDHSLTLKAVAWKDGFPSRVKSEFYELVVMTPAFNPDGGVHEIGLNIIITCPTPEATIHYTTNGLDPTESDPVIPSGSSVFIGNDTFLKARAWKEGFTASSIKSAYYDILDPNAVSMPVFTPNGGYFESDQSVIITCQTPGAEIHYTTNGFDPNQNDPIIANGGSVVVSVDPATILKARAFKTDCDPSRIKAAVYYREKYSGGNGDSDTPYQIADVDDLLMLGLTTEDYDKCFILTADIDLDGRIFTNSIIAADPNHGGTAFSGVFDGNNHKITNFTINAGTDDYFGLFGQLNSDGLITNLGLENCTFGSNYSTGSLVGRNYGVISNCYSTGSVSGYSGVGGLVGINSSGNICNCYSTGTVSGSSDKVGGLAGVAYGFINNCYSTGTVSGSSYIGGLAGVAYGFINNCCSTGAVSGSSAVGGLTGYNYYNSISNCYATGAVSGSSAVGGLVGSNDKSSISCCYSTGIVDGSGSYVGGLVGGNSDGIITNSFWDIQTSGRTTSAGGTGKTTVQMQDINTFLTAGWDFVNETANGTCNYWYMSENSYPVLVIFNGFIPHEPDGRGTEEDPYRITDANDLGTIWYRPSAHYTVTEDIDLAGIQWNTAIVPGFSGIFDGNGFCIRNLSMYGGGFLGLFGRINSRGEVRNLGIENVSVSNSFLFSTGGLAGHNYGTIDSCYSKGTISGSRMVGGLVGYNNSGSLTACYSTGTVSGSSDYVGGLVGNNFFGSISNCFSTGSVFASGIYSYGTGGLAGRSSNGNISRCYTTGSVSSPHTTFVGGLIGSNSQGTIVECYSRGAVIGSSYVGGLVGSNGYDSKITACYSTGHVSGSSYYVGGLVGSATYSTTSSSFWDTQTSGWTTSAGGTPKTTAQMKTLSTFTSAGWDFATIWDICEGTNYPRLQWQIPVADWVCPDGVNLEDLDYLVGRWLLDNCTSGNNYCGGADMDISGKVDLADWMIFAAHWLEGI